MSAHARRKMDNGATLDELERVLGIPFAGIAGALRKEVGARRRFWEIKIDRRRPWLKATRRSQQHMAEELLSTKQIRAMKQIAKCAIPSRRKRRSPRKPRRLVRSWPKSAKTYRIGDTESEIIKRKL
ncbi:MAG: hypothetical protein JWN25_2569 [Verrucomicrobiales bacterium]|nr:hypothetical protein [Verrucomicrobiales bacterium]